MNALEKRVDKLELVEGVKPRTKPLVVFVPETEAEARIRQGIGPTEECDPVFFIETVEPGGHVV